MTITQRHCGMLRRYARELDKQNMPIKAGATRQAATHLETLQAKVDAITSPWQPMKTAPKNGLTVLVLLTDSDIPHAARWVRGPDDPHATAETRGPGWHFTWDGSPIAKHDGPRYWMHCPDDPDDDA